ncbi:MAG: DNA helicase II, partial [Methylococcales bacterium]|nr:DNA helicase II [Methylococcales bacterium]
LAGAGSGKTRVLVHRIAWVMEVEGVSPHGILAVTFTNKAALEMRGRVEALLKFPTHAMWIGTFHGLAHRLLRRHTEDAGLTDGFQILDSDDQYRLIRRLLKALNLDEARWPPRQVQWFINQQKDEGRRAKHIGDTGDPFQRQMVQIYTAYEQACERSGVVDFAELLLRAHELIRDVPGVLDHYQQRFSHVLVDEFQDTNTIQYAWLRLLTQERENLFVVGDDDQSIYGWRGAKVENIYRFQKEYPGHQLIRLEQNYRSTGNILEAANALIANNDARLGKQLWTSSGEGEPIDLYAAFNELDEAFYVIERIRQWINDGNARRDCAILYRSNAQSRLFEEKLVFAGIPYRVYGGLRFFDRAEIKNALAYLRLVANRDDDTSFERVVNVPARSIGAKTVDAIRAKARELDLSLWHATIALLKSGKPAARTANALNHFLVLIDGFAADFVDLDLPAKIQRVTEKSGLIDLYRREKGDKGEARVENLEELVNAARQFDYDEQNEEGLGELDLFLAHAALESGETQGDADQDCVQLMTLHSAKGLEFQQVFIVGMEEGLFPGQKSLEEADRLEEERRLAYVGMTRAMQKLNLVYAESRRLYGRETFPSPSRFIREVPAETMREVRARATISRPVSLASKPRQPGLSDAAFRLGQRVQHAKFGDGIVLQNEGDGKQARVQVNFERAGMKWLMVAYAKLQPL